MARTATQKTKAQIAFESATEKLKTASEALAKASNDNTKKAHAEASVALEAAKKIVNAERWLNLGGVRVGKVIKSLETFANCAKPSSYDLTKDEVELSFQAIENALTKAKGKFEAALAGTKGTTAQSTFKFPQRA